MEQTLLLNATYEPLKIVHWQKAITLLCQGKVEVVREYDREVHSVSITFKLPSVIRLLRYIRIKRRFDYVPFSRANIYARDEHTCQYCGDLSSTSELTFDHVVPVAQGGRKDWENIVTCCVSCNRKKGGRTPAEAGMHLLRMPKRPQSAPAPGETAFIDIAATYATGLHQVDNPVFDRDGNLYVTYSGTRGQQVPVSIFRVRPNGTRETFSSGIVNPTSMAIDSEGRLYASSRFEGIVYRVSNDGSTEPFANDLGVACGLAFAPDGTLFVGDRAGTIFRSHGARHA